jgi:glycosyltransferase involved in cell wall biosynthesis
MQSFIFIDAVSLYDVLHQRMGERGLRLVEEKYTWGAVAETMISKYKEICNGR